MTGTEVQHITSTPAQAVIAIGEIAPLPVRISRTATAHVRHLFYWVAATHLRYGRRTNRVNMLSWHMQVYGNSRVLPIRCEQHAAEQTPSCELRRCRCCCCRGGCTHNQSCNRGRSSRRGQTRISQQASKPHPPCSHRISQGLQTTETPRNGRYSFK
jgi:hypothetical protein